MENTETRTVDFIKTPVLGDVIKVYEQGGFYFGICKGTTHVKRHNTMRQVAVIDKTDKVFGLNQCDFFLESEKVICR